MYGFTQNHYRRAQIMQNILSYSMHMYRKIVIYMHTDIYIYIYIYIYITTPRADNLSNISHNPFDINVAKMRPIPKQK